MPRRQLTQPAAIKRRILRITGETGPRKMNIINAMAGGDFFIITDMLRDGSLVKFGDRRGALYGPPGSDRLLQAKRA